jgi:hypothetical protein
MKQRTSDLALMGCMLNAYKILMGKHQGMMSRERSKNMWVCNIEVERRGTGCKVADIFSLAQNGKQ